MKSPLQRSYDATISLYCIERWVTSCAFDVIFRLATSCLLDSCVRVCFGGENGVPSHRRSCVKSFQWECISGFYFYVKYRITTSWYCWTFQFDQVGYYKHTMEEKHCCIRLFNRQRSLGSPFNNVLSGWRYYLHGAHVPPLRILYRKAVNATSKRCTTYSLKWCSESYTVHHLNWPQVIVHLMSSCGRMYNAISRSHHIKKAQPMLWN